MWKFVSVLSLALFLTSTNSLPFELDTGDESINSKNDGVPTLATELLPPFEDAEVADFRKYQNDKNKRDISTELKLPRTVTVPFREDYDSTRPTLSLELEPPKKDAGEFFNSESKEKENTTFGMIFVINLYAVKNSSGENTEEVLSDDVAEKHPEMLEPVATVLLVVGEGDETKPLDLDEFAKDLEEEGLKVEKITEDGETKVIKVDLDESLEDNDVELIKPGKFNKVRRRRTISHGHGGLLSKLLDKHRGGGCDGTCGGGGYQNQGTVGVIPVVVVPVQGQPQYQQPPQYQPRPQYHPHPHPHPPPQYVQPQPQYVHPQPQYVQPRPQYVQPRPQYVQPQPVYQQPSCNTCGGGNHGSYSQSSAQSSAQSSSRNW